MIKIIFLTIFIVSILYLLKKNSNSNSNSNIYGKLILVVIVMVILFLVATSGKFILPQFLQIIKIGLPLITKFIGL